MRPRPRRRRRRPGRAPRRPTAGRRRCSAEPPPPGPASRPPPLAAQRKHGGGQGVSRPAPAGKRRGAASAGGGSPFPEGPAPPGAAWGEKAASGRAGRRSRPVGLSGVRARPRPSPPPCQRAPSPGGAFGIRGPAGWAQGPARGPGSGGGARGPARDTQGHGVVRRVALSRPAAPRRPESAGFVPGGRSRRGCPAPRTRGLRGAWGSSPAGSGSGWARTEVGGWRGPAGGRGCQGPGAVSGGPPGGLRDTWRRDNSRAPPETGGEGRARTSDGAGAAGHGGEPAAGRAGHVGTAGPAGERGKAFPGDR